MIRIFFVNNLGGGFADQIEVEDNTSIEKFFSRQLPEAQTEDYLIRVNRQVVPRQYMLQDGDRVTTTPVKIQGAAA